MAQQQMEPFKCLLLPVNQYSLCEASDSGQSWGLGLWVLVLYDTNRVRADSGLPHVGLFRAQVRNLHSQSRCQGLHITCEPEERGTERKEKEELNILQQWKAFKKKKKTYEPMGEKK